MPLETKHIKDMLSGCRVLIVEDDASLASRVAALLKDYTCVEPVIAYSIQEANEAVAGNIEEFGLATVDILLPLTDEDFKEIQEHEKTLEHVRKAIEKASTHPTDEDTRRKLFDARYERSQALRRIESLIDREGGINLVAGWREHHKLFPVLFLTAIGNDAMVRQGFSAAKENADWVVKPVSSDLILEKCANLLLKRQAQIGED
jgi:DNA-binding NtrC family response regulator